MKFIIEISNDDPAEVITRVLNTARELTGVAVEVAATEDAPAAPARTRAKPGPKPKPKAEPEPEDEADDGDDEDLLADDEEPTKEDALRAASALLAEGKKDKVRKALESVGVARVGALKPDQVSDFLQALA